jgi:hypothetical protein
MNNIDKIIYLIRELQDRHQKILYYSKIINIYQTNNLELKNINKLEMKFGFLQYQLEVPFEKEQPIEVKIDNEFVNVEYENEKVYIRKNLKLLRENSKNKTDNKRYKSEVLLYYKDRIYDINVII